MTRIQQMLFLRSSVSSVVRRLSEIQTTDGTDSTDVFICDHLCHLWL